MATDSGFLELGDRYDCSCDRHNTSMRTQSVPIQKDVKPVLWYDLVDPWLG